MATASKGRKSRGLRAWVLIRFHGKRGEGAHPTPTEVRGKQHRLGRVRRAADWPTGVRVKRVDSIKRPIPRDNRQVRTYHTFLEVRAANRAALNRALDYIEHHFSHTDVYEF